MLKSAGVKMPVAQPREPGAGLRPAAAEAREKLSILKDILTRMRSVLVAFSGGVDSTFLLKVARDTLGNNAAAITAVSPTYPASELEEAVRLARLIGADQVVVESNELEIPGFAENDAKRCYHCKGELFRIAVERAGAMGLAFVADGSNRDDLDDYRPGSRAAEELGVRSPLREAGLAKDEIRELSRELGLPTWDKPALACLSSRFPYGTRITAERLEMVESGERVLRSMGLTQFRVRYHGETVRIEVEPGEMETVMESRNRDRLVASFKEIGFTYVTLDLQGYRTGSMNEVLQRG